MNIAVILSSHNKIPETLDTLESIVTFATDKVMLIVDGVYWNEWSGRPIPAYKLCGFNHGWYKSPYRNIFLSLMASYNLWGESVDWYCYMEYDCLVGSSAFKKDLQEAEAEGYWCIGNDLRRNQTQDLSFLEKIIKGKFEEKIYLLGACIFYHKKFFKKAMEEDMFNRVLFYTNEFKRGFFPNYDAWDFTEHALPTIVNYYGGKVKQFASYSQASNLWAGNYRKYPIRYRPELEYKEEHFLQASIMHPLKDFANPIREFHRQKRRTRKFIDLQ